MSRFAQYYIKFRHDAGCYEWENRQQYLGALFDKDESIMMSCTCPLASLDRLNKETYFQFLKRSIDTSKDYIKNYRHPFLKDSSILFNIVPFDIENYEGQHQLSSQGDCPL